MSSKAVSVPGKALSGVISYLKDLLPPDQFLQLNDMHGLVVEDLRSQNGQQNSGLADLLLRVKAIAGLAES